jgi:hypothetical protein
LQSLLLESTQRHEHVAGRRHQQPSLVCIWLQGYAFSAFSHVSQETSKAGSDGASAINATGSALAT